MGNEWVCGAIPDRLRKRSQLVRTHGTGLQVAGLLGGRGPLGRGGDRDARSEGRLKKKKRKHATAYGGNKGGGRTKGGEKRKRRRKKVNRRTLTHQGRRQGLTKPSLACGNYSKG